MSKTPMTARGAAKLQEELRYRKSELRPKIIEAIDDARKQGDLRENAEFHAAREQHGFNEGRIQEIESKLSTAQVIDVTQMAANGKVIFGTTVEVADVDSGDEKKYQIVGEDEADAPSGMISLNSPIAKALIGKAQGDVVAVTTPSGVRELEIVAVHYI